MKRVYLPPRFRTVPMIGFAQLTIFPVRDLEDAVEKIRAWVEEGALAEHLEFIPDPNLSFSHREEADEVRPCVETDILNYHTMVTSLFDEDEDSWRGESDEVV